MDHKIKDENIAKIIAAIPEYFFVYDLNKKKVIYFSDSFKKYRLNKEISNINQMRELINPAFLQIFDHIFKAINEGYHHQNEDLKLVTEDNVEKWINISTHPIKMNGVQQIAGHVLDVTARKRLLEKSEKRNEDLQNVLHILAHDLRSPISNLMIILDLQQESIETNQKESSIAYSKFSHRIVREMNTTINCLLELLEIKSAGFQLDKLTVNLADLLDSILDNFQFEIEHKNINLKKDYQDEGLFISLDPVKFKLVIQNLISNAIKFTNDAGEINVNFQKYKKTVKINISDTGIGIPAEHLEDIFNQFTAFRRQGIRGEKTIGLGLSITKHILEHHEGDIEVRSEVNKGTTFTISLPISSKK